MKVKTLIKKFGNLPEGTCITLIRDGFNQDLSIEEALQCKRRVSFFTFHPEVFSFGEEDTGHPELTIEIE